MSDRDHPQPLDALADEDHSRIAPVIEALGRWAEQVRVGEVRRAERRLRGFTATEREVVDATTKSLVRALLRQPTEHLHAARGAQRATCIQMIEQLLPPDAQESAARDDP